MTYIQRLGEIVAFGIKELYTSEEDDYIIESPSMEQIEDSIRFLNENIIGMFSNYGRLCEQTGNDFIIIENWEIVPEIENSILKRVPVEIMHTSEFLDLLKQYVYENSQKLMENIDWLDVVKENDVITLKVTPRNLPKPSFEGRAKILSD